MALLLPSEYDHFYFDAATAEGNGSAASVLAGFTRYERWYVNGSEFWKEKVAAWINNAAMSGKTVLELGAAKGFAVRDLRNAGVNAIGMDISAYAISNCESGTEPYLIQGDVRTDLEQFSRNQFDVVISFRLVECLSDTEVQKLITDCARIGRRQVHIIAELEKDTARTPVEEQKVKRIKL